MKQITKKKWKRRGRRGEVRITKMLNGYAQTVSHTNCVISGILFRWEIQVRKIIHNVVSSCGIKIPRGIRGRCLNSIIGKKRPWSFHLACMIKSVPTLESDMAKLVTDLTSGPISITLLGGRAIFWRWLTTAIIGAKASLATSLVTKARRTTATIILIVGEAEMNSRLKSGRGIPLLVRKSVFMNKQQLKEFMRWHGLCPCSDRSDKCLRRWVTTSFLGRVLPVAARESTKEWTLPK